MKTQNNRPVWFCVRSQPKHEHIAAANLKKFLHLEVFCPRFRSRKLTRRRDVVWVTESLFPNYLFVRFDLETMLNSVRYTQGVSHVVDFGRCYPAVPDQIVEELRQSFGEEELNLCAGLPSEGDEVIIADKAFWGMQGVVLRVMPAQQRIRVLMDVLGRATAVDLKLTSVLPATQPLPARLLS